MSGSEETPVSTVNAPSVSHIKKGKTDHHHQEDSAAEEAADDLMEELPFLQGKKGKSSRLNIKLKVLKRPAPPTIDALEAEEC